MATKAQYLSYLQLPQVRAGLDTIAWAEGGRYNNIFGGRTFSGSQHPNLCIPYRNTCSTAAGRYQFLYRTWIEIKNRLGLADFGPQSQDIAALDLINQRGQLEKLLNGDFEEMMRGLGCAWAALPYATCGQTRRPLDQTMNYYRSAVAAYGGAVSSSHLPASGVGSGSTVVIALGVVFLGVLILD